MRPRALSNDGGDIRLDPACIQPEDQAIHDLTASLRQWNKSSVQSAGAKVEDFRQRLSTRIFAHLMEVDDLWYGDLHLRPVNTPFLPTLMVTEGRNSVELSWSPLILKLYPFGNGYAVCADGTIRPLADGRLLGVSKQLVESLPSFNIEDAALFCERVVLASALPCVLDGPRLPEIREAESVSLVASVFWRTRTFSVLIFHSATTSVMRSLYVDSSDPYSQHAMARGIYRRDLNGYSSCVMRLDLSLGLLCLQGLKATLHTASYSMDCRACPRTGKSRLMGIWCASRSAAV